MVTSERQIPAWLQRLYPFEPKSFGCGQARMSYVDEGPRTDEAVVLLHGNPTWSFYYREVVRRLTAAGLRCVAPDHVGMGLSEKPQHYSYRLATHVNNVAALVGQLGLRRVHLVVHDWGGAIGFGWAALQPEKVGRIVILNTAAFPAPKMPWRIGLCRAPGIGEPLVRGLNGFAGPATWMAVRRRALPPEIKRGYLFPYASWHDRIGIARFVADIPMHPTHPSWPALADAARGLAQFRDRPVLIGWGGADFCFHDWYYDQWRKHFPQAQTHYIADAGHYVLEDAGDELIPRITGFLSEG